MVHMISLPSVVFPPRAVTVPLLNPIYCIRLEFFPQKLRARAVCDFVQSQFVMQHYLKHPFAEAPSPFGPVRAK